MGLSARQSHSSATIALTPPGADPGNRRVNRSATWPTLTSRIDSDILSLPLGNDFYKARTHGT